jgi:ribosome biogenesis GTPase
MQTEGRVIRSTGSFYTVLLPDGHTLECRLKGKFRIKNLKNTNPVVVGDRVGIETTTSPDQGMIIEIFPRANYIIRKATNLSKSTHIIASNIDQVLLIATLHQPRTSTGFIDRVLVTAEAYQIPATIIFNKTDLYDTHDKSLLEQLAGYYAKCGYQTINTSAVSGLGLKKLGNLIRNRTSLLTGHSGVGKSALINCLEPGINIKIGDISQAHLKGRHTTTFAQMYYLSLGGYIVDTPGIKEFGLIDFKKDEVALYFPELKDLLNQCQFYNCTHDHEPGCAVKKALANGEIAAWRYQNYLNIIHDSKLDIPEWE